MTSLTLFDSIGSSLIGFSSLIEGVTSIISSGFVSLISSGLSSSITVIESFTTTGAFSFLGLICVVLSFFCGSFSSTTCFGVQPKKRKTKEIIVIIFLKLNSPYNF